MRTTIQRRLVLAAALVLGACGAADQPVGASGGTAGAAGGEESPKGGSDATPGLDAEAGSLPDADSADEADSAAANRAVRKPTCPTPLATCVASAPPITLDDACRGLRWIGVLRTPANPCPDPSRIDAGGGGASWTAERLFGDDASPSGLAAFCAYTWTPPRDQSDLVPAKEVQFLGAFGASLNDGVVTPFTAIGKDCHAVGVQDTAVTQAVSALAETAYYTQVGQVAPLPDGAADGPLAVRVAVADSTPHGYDEGLALDGRSDHGLNVGRIIRKIACPGDGGGVNCAGFISNHLALPQVTPVTATPAVGGFYGYQSQLAASIYTAVSDWKLHNAAPPAGESAHERLVINLSVGWDPAYGGTFNANSYNNLTPPMRAVYYALMHASCHGALIVAAAGNDPGGAAPAAGPMYPAAWEKKGAPTAAQCSAFEGAGFLENPDRPTFPLPGNTVYRPLLYSVAGVGHNDYPLANARTLSASRLVALGQMAATPYEVSPGNWVKTQAITGSSAAAAAVSGAAAALWGYRPALRSYEVADALYNSAVSVDPAGATRRRADVCLTGFTCSTLSVKRLDVCAALNAACSGAPDHCFPAASAPVCAPVAAYAGPELDLSPADADYAATAPDVFDGSLLTATLPALSLCKHAAGKPFQRTAAAAATYPDDPCPLRQYYNEGAQPWVGPQPTTPICSECKLGAGVTATAVYPKSGTTLNVLLDSAYAASNITNGVLEFLGATGSVIQSAYLRDLGLPATMSAGYSYVVTSFTVKTKPTSARLTFTVTDKSAPTVPYSRQAVVTLY